MPLLLCVLLFMCVLSPNVARAHEFDPERIEIFDAKADVFDGDTSRLYVQMTIANGAATNTIVGFETNRGTVSDWIEIRKIFGRERIKALTHKTVRTNTLYEMQRPDGYLVITDVDPTVYSADFGYILVHVLFADGAGLDVAAWIDPIYVAIGEN